MIRNDQEFVDWLMQYRSELGKECQTEVVDNAIKAMGDSRAFCFWIEAQHLGNRKEIMDSYPNDFKRMKILCFQGNVLVVIKNKWQQVVQARVAEMNPPGAGKSLAHG